MILNQGFPFQKHCGNVIMENAMERERLHHLEDDLRVKDYAISSSINGIAIGNLDGIVTYINQAGLTMWGADDPSEIIGKSATVFAQSESEAFEIMRTVIEKGAWCGEISGWRKNGAPITVLMSASLVRDDHEQPICMVCSFIDITERKRIEEELRIKESAIASSINGIAIGDLKGKVTYINNAVLHMWGADDPGDIIGKPATVFAQSEEEAVRIMQTVLEEGQWAGEITGKIMDGSPITVHLSASLVRDEQGKPICLMCSFIDVTERKRIENELRIKDSAIASSLNGIGIGDLNGNIVYVNDAALKMWGAHDPSEIIGRSALEFADSQEEALRVFQEFMEKGGWSGEISGRRKDGSLITVHLTASMVRNERGEPVCSMDSFVDITDRKRMEEELRVKDFAIASSLNGIGIGDLAGTIMYVNEAAVKMWGASDPSEVIGKSPLEFADSPEEAQRVYQEFMENGGWSGEISGRRKDGSIITVHLTASLVRNEKGDPICTMVSFVDITDRKRIEEELKIKDLAIASSIDGIGIGDLEGNIIYVNDAALKMWGTEDASEVLGTSALSLAQSEEEAVRIYQTVLEKGSWAGEVSGYRKDGSPITVLLTASLVRNEKGEPICMMDSFVDITGRKRMEEELKIKDFAIASSINGIVIGDLEGTITYVNDAFLELWGGSSPEEVIGRSALTFAKSSEEAEKILQAVIEQGNWKGEITARKKNGSLLAVQLSANMVRNADGAPICLMASLVDISERMVAEQKLQRAYEGLEQRVEERTKELVRANIRLKKEIEERKQAELSLLQKEEELRLKSVNLEEANTALKVLLKRGEQDRNELEDKVLSNIKELVVPYINKLRNTPLDERQKTFLEILDSNLNDIISPFLKKLSSQYLNLTPTEIQVANLIRDGKSTKEIAEVLNISKRAIEFHRNNIRDKLGLKKSRTNLRSYLLTLS